MRNFYAGVLLGFLTLTGCSKLDELTQFHMDYEQSVVIPSSTGVALPFSVSTPDTQTDSESEFSVNDTRKDLIEEIKITALRLELSSPEGADFSFLESIEVYISAEGLDEVKIAWNDAVPTDAGSTLTLETSDVDLQEYIKKDSFTLRLSTVTDETLATAHEINVFSTFFVDARILGL